MSLNNPAKFFVTGNDEESFTYEGGDTLWHFSPNQSGLSRTMEMNIIFFANEPKHALDVVRRMLEFAVRCENMKWDNIHKDLEDRRGYKVKKFQYLLDNQDKWIVTLAPLNQVFKTGWASNDTI